MMKNLTLLALAGAATLVATFVSPVVAMAQDVKPPEVNISGVHVKRDENPMTRYMSEYEFTKFKRTYELSNGDTLSLFSRSNLKYAKLGDGNWHSIVATGSNSFVSMDHQLKMEINLKDDETVSGYLWIPASSPAVAGNDVTLLPTIKVVFR
jgi:hypothetical protein